MAYLKEFHYSYAIKHRIYYVRNIQLIYQGGSFPPTWIQL